MLQRFFTVLSLLLLLSACTGNAQRSIYPELTGNITKDLKSLLREGEYEAEVMDKFDATPAQDSLLKKMYSSIDAHEAWYAEYSKSIPSGEKMPYHPNFGITEPEYNELQMLLANAELKSSGSVKLTIRRNNLRNLSFKAIGKAEDISLLEINPEKNEIFYDYQMLHFSDTLNMTDNKNGLKTKWKGYQWVMQTQSAGFNASTNSFDKQKVSGKQYILIIGRLESTGKPYISLQGKEISNGELVKEFEVPLRFK